tara:strand:+ start:1003 stop:1284 length:282 start_codon:yes stop_codon:yes gene_type:complete
MKMTIVIDSDDPQGIADTLRIAQMMNAKYGTGYTTRKLTFTKIGFIKEIRKYMKETIKLLNDEECIRVSKIDDMASLRNAKVFADKIFDPNNL